MSFDDVFEFSKQFWFDVRAQVDDGSGEAVVLQGKNIRHVCGINYTITIKCPQSCMPQGSCKLSFMLS